MALVETWSSETITALESSEMDPFTHHIMQFSFGTDYRLPENDPDDLKRQLLGTMRQLNSYIVKLKGDDAWRLSLVETNGVQFFGNTIATATQGNMIWLSRSLVEDRHRIGLAKTIAHEGFHAMRSFSSDHYINDFWYVGRQAPLANAPAGEITDYSFGVEYSSLRVANISGPIQAPVECEMGSGPRQQYIRLIDRLLINVGAPASASSEERADIYQEEAAARQSVVLQNADSLAMILMARHRTS
ncbi:hypothetical protein PS862_05138 [Pseudomonas fluorescens]|uniref:Uncharacterized protein n=2 Tax=Pseudomonas fluorescens TaxID=294 RepID=A0A5E7P9T7_PSEFL|nr:hypothetical protein PS862_05138 [Pseudomonas fluorescens]